MIYKYPVICNNADNRVFFYENQYIFFERKTFK